MSAVASVRVRILRVAFVGVVLALAVAAFVGRDRLASAHRVWRLRSLASTDRAKAVAFAATLAKTEAGAEDLEALAFEVAPEPAALALRSLAFEALWAAETRAELLARWSPRTGDGVVIETRARGNNRARVLAAHLASCPRARALEVFGPIDRSTLVPADEAVRRAAISMLAPVEEPNALAAVAFIESATLLDVANGDWLRLGFQRSTHAGARLQCFRWLDEHGQPDANLLADVLGDPDERIRVAGAYALATRFKDARGFTVLFRALRSMLAGPDAETIVVRAARGLGALKDRRTVHALAVAHENERRLDARAALDNALAAIVEHTPYAWDSWVLWFREYEDEFPAQLPMMED